MFARVSATISTERFLDERRHRMSTGPSQRSAARPLLRGGFGTIYGYGVAQPLRRDPDFKADWPWLQAVAPVRGAQ
jgi:hypothetical protein